jgi:hypothetical protein
MPLNIYEMNLKGILIRVSFMILISSFHYLSIKAEIHQPQLLIPYVRSAPIIDGKLNDDAWQRSVALSEFIVWTLDDYNHDSVTVFMCYDDKNLYIAFRCSDSSAQEMKNSISSKGPRDSYLWGKNFLKVLIDYKDISTRLMADPNGTMTDYRNDDISWNGNWQFAASVNKENWTGEFSIPFSDLGINATTPNEKFSIDLSKSSPIGESANWQGMCVLSGPANIKCEYGRWPEPVPGKNSLSFNVSNLAEQDLNIECELELIPINEKPEFINQTGQGPSSEFQIKLSSEPLHYITNYIIPSGGRLNEALSYSLPKEGSYYASVLVKLNDGTIIRRSRDFFFTIEPNRSKLQRLNEKIGESIASISRLSNPAVVKFRNENYKISTRLKQISNFADTAWSSGGWSELTTQVDYVDHEISRHLHKLQWLALHNWKLESDFGVTLVNSITKIRQDALVPRPICDQIDLSLARNEYESFQLVVLPFGNDINKFAIDVSDLRNKNGNTISKSNVEVSMINYNKIDWQPEYVIKYKGWYPDPLIPYKPGATISGDDVCRPYWITVYAPSGTSPGDYSGTITISAAGMKKITAIVKCRVWDFDLPLVSHLKTHSWDKISYLSEFYNLKEYPIEWYMRFCALLLKNRLNPGFAGINYVNQLPDKNGRYDFSDVEKVLEFCMDRGLSRFSILQLKKGVLKPEEIETVYKFVAAYAKFLRQKGWLDKALVELWDEPTDLEWPDVKARAEKLKLIDPGLRLQLFAEGGPYDFWDKKTDKYGLNKLIDIWSPYRIVESPEMQSRGVEIWSYFCTLSRENSPNFYIDCPPVYQRTIAWYCWMYGLDGFEHWGTNYFWRNVKAGKPMDQKWPDKPWDYRSYNYYDGEGQLIYPGMDGMIYSSIRLENFRDGMEDYEYLFRLKELLSKYKNDSSNTQLDEYRHLLNPEYYLLYKYQHEIKSTLENTLRYPEEPERILYTREKIALAIENLQKNLQEK